MTAATAARRASARRLIAAQGFAGNLPDNNRWSLNGLGGCGQRCFLRPCQAREVPDEAEHQYPLDPACQSGREMSFVVDDDPAVREEMVEFMSSIGFPAVGCADAAEFRALAPNYDTGCVLLDVKLPGEDGVALRDWIERMGLSLSVVFMSGTQDIGTVVHCMQGGAVEYLQKPVGEMAVRNAVRQAIGHSRMAFCRAESVRFVTELVNTLTPAELQVARLISAGYPTKVIASEIGRSENTIKIHRHRIFNKLMVGSAASVANVMAHWGD